MGTTVSKKWGKEYLDVFKGIVSMPAHMSRSLIMFAHAIKVLIENETEKLSPDNHLIGLLIDAARLGYEQITWAYSDPHIEDTQEVSAEVEAVYQEFWKVIIEKNGMIDLSQVKKELFDFRTAMKEVSAAYMHLTNGQFSKVTTPHQVIIDAVEKQSLPDPPSESDDSCSPTEGLVCQTCGNSLVVLATKTTEYGKLKTISMECSGCKEESTLTVRHKWGVVDYE